MMTKLLLDKIFEGKKWLFRKKFFKKGLIL